VITRRRQLANPSFPQTEASLLPRAVSGNEQPAKVRGGNRVAGMQQQRQLECENEAILQHQDPSRCRIETLPQENPANPNRGKSGK
jgi:hypothetical protein